MSEMESFPKLIKVWPDFGKALGLGRVQAYETASKLPPGVIVRIGGKVRINQEKLRTWIDKGGDTKVSKPRKKQDGDVWAERVAEEVEVAENEQ